MTRGMICFLKVFYLSVCFFSVLTSCQTCKRTETTSEGGEGGSWVQCKSDLRWGRDTSTKGQVAVQRSRPGDRGQQRTSVD